MAFNRWSSVIRNAISSSSRKNRSMGAAASCGWRRALSQSTVSSPSSSPSMSSYHVGGGGPSYMRGVVFWEPNKPLAIEEFQMPRPKANEVLIRTKACGVCHSDLHVIKGELPFSSPRVVGHEITGEVVEHGPLPDRRIIERYPVRARVVGAFTIPCGNNFFCTKGQDDLCASFFAYNRAKGTLYDGETRLFLCNSESAILGCAVFTAYGAMTHAAEVRPGDTVGVIGIGGVGSSCLQIARAFGASEIITVDAQDDKPQKAKILGATHAINARNEDAVEKIRADRALQDV
ncbi:Succinate-semialdehyde dehydrogenase (acetylating) [Bertholletia excelsa]